jgi:hypothetical protein
MVKVEEGIHQEIRLIIKAEVMKKVEEGIHQEIRMIIKAELNAKNKIATV